MSLETKVSIIVPVYNVEKYLERCLLSLVQQTLDDIEIIVVNDGTKDHSQEIIDDFVEKYPDKIISLIKENGGLSDARNFGIPYAHGEYIGFVDSDDYTDIMMYEKLYNKAKADDADIVVCGYYGINETNSTFKVFQKGNMNEFNKSLRENPKLLYLNSTYAWNKLYRKELFDKTGILYPKGTLFEDMAVTWSLFPHANKISKVDEPLYYYILKREGAITATYSDKMLQMFDSMAIVNEYYIANNLFDEFREYLCFLNMKHTFIRIKDFSNYQNKDLKNKFIHAGLNHLNKYFPDWRNCSVFFDDVYRNKKFMKLFKYVSFWKAYKYMPRHLVPVGSKILKSMQKLKYIWKKKSYITRYYYTKVCKKHEIIKKQVLFESYQGATMSDSPYYMMLELAKDKDYKIYFSVDKYIYKECLRRIEKLNLDICIIKKYSRKYQFVLGTSEFLVTNVSFPPYVIRRNEQKLLNTWHGTPLKTLGKSMKYGIQDMSNMQRNFLQSTLLLYPNKYTMECMMKDYNLMDLYTNKVMISGYPRNTIFRDTEKAKEIKKQLGLSKIEQIAYMPTWRGATSTSLEIKTQLKQIEFILSEMDSILSDNQKCFVNLHSLIHNKINYSKYKHIDSFPSNMDNYEFLNSCDVLITDYSSVFFDYSITRKPIALFTYDLEEYSQQRGMYLDIQNLPFPILKTVDDLKAFLIDKNKHWIKNDLMYDYENDFIKNDSLDNIKLVNSAFFYDDDIHTVSCQLNKEKKYHLYLMPKIKEPKDRIYFEELIQNPDSLAVFDRSDFTPITQNILFSLKDTKFNFIIMDVRMQLSLKEELSRILKKRLSDDVYRKELQRILPDIKIYKCTDYKKSAYTNGIKKAIERMR